MKDQDDDITVEPLELPDIPDYPEAPLPAWKHYGITNFASQKIVEELDNAQYSGYMVGLEVGYSIEEEKTYAMSFGKVHLSDEHLEEQEEPELPVSDEFLVHLYQTIHDYMEANVPDGGKLNPELTFVISGSLIAVKVMCRQPQSCDRRHAGKRWCKRVNRGPWRCLHSGQCT